MADSKTPSALPASVLESIKVIFFEECEELVAELESCLLALENGEADAETVNAAFRAAHSIKGSAGAFGFDTLVKFSHVFESALDRVRSGKAPSGVDVPKTLLRATDVIADLVRAARDGGEPEAGQHSTLMAELEHIAAGETAAAEIEEVEEAEDDLGFDFTPVPVDLSPMAAEPPEPNGRACWTIRLQPQASFYARANDALLLLRELKRMGDIAVVLHDEALPSLPELDPEGAYLAWTVTLWTDEPEDRIREVFEFVEEDCEIVMAARTAPAMDAEPVATSAPPAPFEAVPELEPVAAATVETAAPRPVTPSPAAPVPTVAAPASPTIRVDLDRVDRLINLVGELIINQAVMAQRMTESGVPRSSHTRAALDDLEQLTRELQDSVMAIRAQPVKSVFQRMSRLVREVEEITGKQVHLVTEGEATEVDKTIIERLADPITHMIRNAIDHGIEAPAVRAAAGKPDKGLVRLSARHRSGRILIEVADDGGGVNRERVRAIAVERGLVAPDAELSDSDIDNLIFAPGFSTAETITDLSGRGVGLDVVRRSVQSMGGRISIVSRPGEGSAVTLSLPLTLAVMDGMVASVAGQTLVAPLSTVVQTLRPTPGAVRKLGADTRMLWVGDGHLPLIDVGVMLGYRAEPIDPTTGVVLLVDGGDGARGALVVDDIQDQRQVVIKSLEANYQSVDGVAAATILGDGRVALILDVDKILSGSARPVWRPDPRVEAGALCA